MFLTFFQTTTNMPLNEVKISNSLSAKHQAHVQFKRFADDNVNSQALISHIIL